MQYDRSVTNSLQDAASLCVSITSALQALSNAALFSVTGIIGEVLAPNQYGSALTYANAETKAKLTLLAADHSVHRLEIPAPVLSMFEADQQTVLGSAISTLVGLLTQAPIASSFACVRTGSPFAASVGGLLVRRPFQRKITIYDLSANLDEPEE
jgi:hypothetical protein